MMERLAGGVSGVVVLVELITWLLIRVAVATPAVTREEPLPWLAEEEIVAEGELVVAESPWGATVRESRQSEK